ncbi:uncharacterized protein [Rutidosis leptorrhynchoides]|uniref:uncharacterized protein n=1 Tax=Rutidosis leptorrhynchoides TaxID=125765 RepID=UPI003A999FCA
MSSSDEESLVNAMKSIFAYRNNVVIRREVEEQNEAQSSRRKRRYIHRDRVEAHNRLMKDYFVQDPKYPPEYFKRRYRMSQSLLEKIIEGILSYSTRPNAPKWFTYFQQCPDARGVLGVSTILKVTSAIRQLAYGDSPDLFDEYLQISERTSHIRRLYHKHEELHGFPGMLGSIDCMHWAWGKCPNAWKGHFTRGDHGYPTIMLEAVALYDNWIWHAYFGMADLNNDLYVLNASPLFDSLLTDTAPQVPYEIGDVDFDRGYYLADGIYPSWYSFVKGFSSVVDAKRKYFTKKQSTARKDVERTFGILQGRWGILRQPARAYSVNAIKRIMYGCIILHNMIIEDNGFNIAENKSYYLPVNNLQGSTWYERCDVYAEKTKELRDKDEHEYLRHTLVSHLWHNHDDQIVNEL